MTRIGVGGLINLEKLQQAHTVLNDIYLFQQHASHHMNNQGAGGVGVEHQDSSQRDSACDFMHSMTPSTSFRYEYAIAFQRIGS